jgi:peptidoglycan-associated lipoprotein
MMVWIVALSLTACAGSKPGALSRSGPQVSAVSSGAGSDVDGSGLGLRPTVEEIPLEVQRVVTNLGRVHFETDTSRLTGDSVVALSDNAAILARYPDVHIEVQGHADARGTTDYNLALGHRRAQAVQRALQAHGVTPDRVQPTTLGEERPLDGGVSERAWSANRRVEFRVTWGGDGRVAGTVD